MAGFLLREIAICVSLWLLSLLLRLPMLSFITISLMRAWI